MDSTASRSTKSASAPALGMPLVLLLLATSMLAARGGSSGITLTFVFDSTGSMSDELNQVKQAMQEIFDYMKTNRTDDIANFALVEFNDPYARLLTITTDASIYRKKLSEIKVDGGGDCPEMAMKGIKIALEESLPNSYLFVFTDASAKDYNSNAEVENLIQRKKSKVIFVLTGKCSGINDPGYLVYDKIAQISNGQVFNLLKHEVTKVLEFVKMDTGRKGVVKSGELPQNRKTAIKTAVDESMKELTVTVTGKHPKIELTDPTGNKTNGETILDLDSVQSKQIKNPKPGNWTVDVEAKSPGRFVITTESSFNFIYGFSVKPTEEMEETAPRPLIGRETALLIKVTNQSNLIHLKKLEIRDTTNTVIESMALHPIKGRSDIYKVKMFLPPTSVFLLEVLGEDSKGNLISRVSDTGIIPQPPALPILTLAPELTATLQSPYTLICHIESLVPFTASWSKGSDIVVPEKTFSQTAQVLYYINNTEMSTGGIYTCKARNIAGEDSKNVKLNVQVPPPLVKTPRIVEVRANDVGEIPCQIKSDLDFTVTWKKKEIIGSFQRIRIGNKFTITPSGHLIISTVDKSDKGEYQCSAESIFGTGHSQTLVEVIEPVQVSIVADKLKFKAHEHFQLTCLASGSEPIFLVWKKNGVTIKNSDSRVRKAGNKQIILKIRFADKSDAGIYECEASNKLKAAGESVELVYLEPPKVKILPSHGVPLNGRKYGLHCSFKGSPKPTISWSRNGEIILDEDFAQVIPNGTLVIPKLSLNHTGQYHCVAENEVGKAEAEINLDVVSAPKLEIESENIEVKIYKNTSVICNVSGYPSPKIRWARKDGKPISNRFSEEFSCSMAIIEVQPEDEGIYIVTATNKFGEQNKEFSIHVTGVEKPILADARRKEISVARKEKELTCQILKGTPPPSLRWYKDGEVLTNEDLLKLEGKIHENGSLIFLFIKPDNEGTYDCEASNTAGKARRTVSLEVQEAPVFIDSNHIVFKARVGSAVPLSCEAYGNPKPSIMWKRDNKQIKNSTNITLSSEDGSLHILSTSLENNGTYECVAHNAAGENKKTIDLLLLDTPHIHTPSAPNVYIEKGEELALICEVEAYPFAEIKWLKDGSPFDGPSVSYTENNSSIRLTADLSSSGQYICSASNEAGSDKVLYNVSVTVAPFFENTEEYVEANLGDNVTLSCYTDAVPPADYYWLKFPDTEPTIGESTVTFENVDESYAGLYRCDVTNSAGLAQKSIILTISAPPRVMVDLPKNHFLRKGAYFNMPCYAEGDPSPTIKWLKNGKPILSLEDEGLLEIKNASEKDAGIYTCVAENTEGSDERNMKIIVGVKPAMDETYSKNIEVKEGDSVLVSCPAISGIPPPNVQWLKDGVSVNATRRVSPKDKNRALNVKKAKMTDEGVYTCVASNSLGNVQANIGVQVLAEPNFLNGTTNVTINQLHGTPVYLDCSNTGKPEAEVTWFKKDHHLLPLLHPHIEIKDSYVIIKNSSQADQAVYKCIAQNKAGQIERSFNVKIFVSAVEEGYNSFDGKRTEWGSWSLWSSCSASCGESERVRFRKCSTDIVSCEGESEEWQQCLVPECKVDGDWSSWKNWTECSVTCGSGVRFRERFCDNPLPKHGGKICFGANRQHESCNTHPCPVDGSWSTWSTWQPCSGSCVNSTSKRTRKCANPKPAFGGKKCTGSKMDYKPCVQEKCPVNGGWSEWSTWSTCSASCGYSISFRERQCNNPSPKLNGLYCTGLSRETKICETVPCDTIPTQAIVAIKGMMNGHRLRDTQALVNITDLNKERLVEAQIAKIFKRKLTTEWFPYLSLLISPITWLTAYQNGNALNGYSLTKGIFEMHTFIKFTSGEEVTVKHIGNGVESDGRLIIYADIHGATPLFPKGSPVKLEPYEENYIQTGPGELYVSSGNTVQGGGISIPYFWNKTIKYNEELGKLPSVIETLTVKNTKVRKMKLKEEGFINVKAVSTCPNGFELLNSEFCQDIDECSNRRLNNCHFTQTCINYKGTYTCSCPPGFGASSKGGKCTDINECNVNPHICSHKCVNVEGSFKCLCPPGFALLESKTNCSSILPIQRIKGGEINNWNNCLPKQKEVDGTCEDKNPCEDNIHICREDEICATMHGLYKCISVPCPLTFERLSTTKNCIKYCNNSSCESGATDFEMVIPIILTPGGPIAPYKDLIHLSLNISSDHLSHTSFQMLQNVKGKPFRVKNIDGEGVIYSTELLTAGGEFRITVLAITYDASNTNILFIHKFNVVIHSPTE